MKDSADILVLNLLYHVTDIAFIHNTTNNPKDISLNMAIVLLKKIQKDNEVIKYTYKHINTIIKNKNIEIYFDRSGYAFVLSKIKYTSQEISFLFMHIDPIKLAMFYLLTIFPILEFIPYNLVKQAKTNITHQINLSKLLKIRNWILYSMDTKESPPFSSTKSFLKKYDSKNKPPYTYIPDNKTSILNKYRQRIASILNIFEKHKDIIIAGIESFFRFMLFIDPSSQIHTNFDNEHNYIFISHINQ